MQKAVRYSNIGISVLLALCLSIVPLNVKINDGFHIERNDAHAVAPVFLGASAFLAEMAAAAGLTTGELVATVAGMTAVGVGMSIATDAGVRYGTDASQNLNNLIDAADYPSWSSLSSSEQANWGSEENYDSAKFNSLMSGFGMGSASGRYASAWGSGGAGNFSFTTQEQTALEQIGDIAENWKSGAGNTISDILGLVDDPTVIQQWSLNNVGTYVADPNDTNWPSTLSRNVNFTVTDYIRVDALNGSSPVYYEYQYSSPVYVVPYYVQTSNNVNFVIPTGSNSSYTRRSTNNGLNPSTSSSSSATSNGHTFQYITGNRYIGTMSNWTPNVATNGYLSSSSDLSVSQKQYVLSCVMFGSTTMNNYDIQDYPTSDIGNGDLDATIVYFPSQGITDDTPWDDFLTYQEQITEDLSGIITLLRHIDSDLHKFNFFSNGDLKVHDLGVFNELSDIYALMLEISGKIVSNDILDSPDIIGEFDFDDIGDRVPDLTEAISDLAPFGVLALLSETIAILSSVAQIEEPALVFPFEFGGFQDQELEIDLSFLDPIKPMINFACISLLMFGLISASLRVVEIEAAS